MMFGATMPDGGLLLDAEEVEWLKAVVDRLDVARARIVVDTARYDGEPAFARHVDRHVREACSAVAAEAERCVKVADTSRDKPPPRPYETAVQCELYVIRGGLPPFPASAT